jgi:hypothetical protein
MTFDEWFTKERKSHGEQYVMMGPFALRNIAKLAYEEGKKEGIALEKQRAQQVLSTLTQKVKSIN